MNLNWLLEEFDGIIYVSDINTYELLYLNNAGCKMYKTTKDEIKKLKLTCYEMLQGRSSPCPFCTNNMIKDTGFYEWEHYNPIFQQTYLLKDRLVNWDGRLSRIEFATDITLYRDKIKSKEKERDSVLRTLPGGIARIDARDLKTILWYGADFLNMLGYTTEQFENELQSQCNYIHPEDLEKVTKIMENLKNDGKTVITEMRIITRDKNIKVMTTTFSYEGPESSEDNIPSIYSIGIDITDVKRQEELHKKALEEAYTAAKMANKAKTDFLSHMSHDIRTPMNAILGMTSIASSNLNDTSKVSDCLKKINSSSKHLLSLINEVLDMSKIESGRIDITEDNFDLAEIVQNVMDIFRPLLQQKKHNIKIDIKNITHEKLIGDADRLQQVFVNILSNAIKYTPDEGHINIKISEKKTYVPNVSLFQFIIEDNGIGMSEDFLKQIFEPFSRAVDSRISKIQGTGLGMAISENIIHMMNGTISVESEIGKGSRFTVSLSLKLQNISDELNTLNELAGLPVLVVDDDKDVCENTCSILNEIGMMGKWVLSGYDCIDEVVKARDKNDDFFAIILDWQMPVMDGLQTVKAIRSKVGQETPVIILSAYDYSELENELISAGVDAFVTKPLFKSKIIRTFRQFTASRLQINENLKLPDTENILKNKRILLVEDNELNREIAVELLQFTGANIETAENGLEAFNMFKSNSPAYYDLILMDIQMPVMNGLESTAAIRSLEREDAKLIPILALTANAFSEDIINAKKCGINEHISKPIEAEKMYGIIKKWLIN